VCSAHGGAYLWGLAAFGQAGVERIIEILREETRGYAAGRRTDDQASHAGDGEAAA
jgi:FMN-dependent dehydrogenase